jgi:hypothetical protein
LLLLPFFITVAIKYSMTGWINSYLCNHCPSPLKLWVRIPFIVTCTRYNFMWKICQWLVTGAVVFFGIRDQ